MPNTKEILNWHLSFADMKYAAEHVFSQETKNIVYVSTQQLKELSQRLPDGNKLPEKKLIKDVYLLFQKESNRDFYELRSLFNRRDTRVLVYALDYRPENGGEIILFSDKFDTARNIIVYNWRDSFLISLWHMSLKNWNKLLLFEKQRSSLSSLMFSKSQEYEKSRKDIINVIKNIKFFTQKDSPYRFAKYLIDNRKLINDAPSLMKQKEYILVYEYFSSVLENYIELLDKKVITNEVTTSVYNFLTIHNNKKTTIISCSQVINSNKFNRSIEIVKKQTELMIGDPIKKHLWRYEGLTVRQEDAVELARRKLNAIMNQRFIKVFFEKLVQDDRRKRYWLKFIEKIDDIKFCGNRDNFRYLKNIESISKYVDSRYKITSRNQPTCALVIYARNYIFVEFSDTGALYIYKYKNFRVNLNSLGGIEDLKKTHLDYACKNAKERGGYYDYDNYEYVYDEPYDMNEEGKVTHGGAWEERVDAWMEKYFTNSVLEPQVHKENRRIKKDNNTTWESKTLLWSKIQQPGYTYSRKKDAWWKYK